MLQVLFEQALDKVDHRVSAADGDLPPLVLPCPVGDTPNPSPLRPLGHLDLDGLTCKLSFSPSLALLKYRTPVNGVNLPHRRSHPLLTHPRRKLDPAEASGAPVEHKLLCYSVWVSDNALLLAVSASFSPVGEPLCCSPMYVPVLRRQGGVQIHKERSPVAGKQKT